jgi:prepilin peptidase dependent protein B
MLTRSPAFYLRHKKAASKKFSRGFSIIEMMIGVAIGLFILSGATLLLVGNITNSRKIVLETRVNQDLRAALDLVVRDFRRGGYWGNAIAGTVAVGTSTTANPYTTVSVTGTNQINYSYSRDTTENNTLDTATEQFGFRLNSNALQMQTGIGFWQTMTDTNLLNITAFTITPTVTSIDIRAACEITCTGTSCPTVVVRSFNIVLTGVAKSDANVSRTLRSQVRVRNDAWAGTCPVS